MVVTRLVRFTSMHYKRYYFTIKDLAAASGLGERAVRREIMRMRIRPDEIADVARWLIAKRLLVRAES